MGPNGAGKTSLLESIYLLATTRSFRTSQVADCIRHGEREFHLAGEIEAESRTRLEVGLGVAGRYRAVNGSQTSLVEHLRSLPVVAWTTADSELTSGGPEHRRRFLDQGIVGTRPTSLEVLTRFRRALAQKRELLMREGADLAVWNEVLASAASELMALRSEYLEQVDRALREVLAESDLDLPELTLAYEPSLQVEPGDTEAVQAALEGVSVTERREKRPIIGPQRDEISILWGEHGVRKVGSSGERKILGLMLTAARGRVLGSVGREPVYLLDDADSELDKDRLAAAWRVFEGANQAFFSTSNREVWKVAKKALRWEISEGRIESP